ncbi:hypothetical protein [Adlercreutzia sp.]|uniref:hypothetical protein n=1 Tax=Adlercreutzia sp. TaxID=1872387 RepID=UPI002670FA61|nr:hypothetical protein [uncultured Adlercreutzia sp.]MEE0308399.1 hypothetical protein [Adlercreutzia sp.]
MTRYWDSTDSSGYDTDPVFIGRYWGDVLRDDAFVARDGFKSSSEAADGDEAGDAGEEQASRIGAGRNDATRSCNLPPSVFGSQDAPCC